ncbi:hypothetical protein FRD01_22580 [Microvenator marinus]|uniref:Macro domain-containing protein n=1 Tax=Microvenator marinus TaxID=2600177 RepID=A0A5B8Y2T7_9DELT|nr:macro domain-containing protein [Microvenator marinus]QED29969.1 hypothetical protein FRD01_22580 [Microvenator marinus]
MPQPSEPWSWSLGSVTLEVRGQSLLDAPERAWVSSEDSGFYMARNPSAISGQLRRHFPYVLDELRAQTRGEVLPPGTTLRTNGPEGRVIFHAGFHHPNDWDLSDDELVAKHASMIQRCIEDILESVAETGLESVAFPMLGTGLFHLPVSVFAETFFEAVAMFSRRTHRAVKVVLCILEPALIEEVVRFGTRALGAMVGGGEPLLREAGGHPIVQGLRHTARALADEKLQERNLLHFAEIALMTDLALFYDFEDKPPSVLLDKNGGKGECNLTFGIIRNRLEGLRIRRRIPEWAMHRYQQICSQPFQKAIGRLVGDRNDYAHNRRPRPVEDIVTDIESLFGPEVLTETWKDAETHRWIRSFPAGYGLLDGVDPVRGRCSWLIPEVRQRVHEDFEMDVQEV